MPGPGRGAARPARRGRRGRCRRPAAGSSYVGTSSVSTSARWLSSSARRSAWSRASVEQAGDQRRRCPVSPPRVSSVDTCFLVTLPARIAVRSSSSRSRGRTWLTTTPPTGSPCSRSSAMPSAVSCTGISSSTVTRWHGGLRRAEQPGHRVGLALDRAHPGQPGQLVVDPEELRDPAGRRRVEHDGVVGDRVLVAGVALGRLVDLAGQQHVADAGGDGGRELDDAEAVERLPGPAELVVHREVLQQRRLRVDVQRVDHAAALALRPDQTGGDPALGVRQRLDVEHPGDALPALDLAEQHVACRSRPAPARARRRRSTSRCRPCR